MGKASCSQRIGVLHRLLGPLVGGAYSRESNRELGDAPCLRGGHDRRRASCSPACRRRGRARLGRVPPLSRKDASSRLLARRTSGGSERRSLDDDGTAAPHPGSSRTRTRRQQLVDFRGNGEAFRRRSTLAFCTSRSSITTSTVPATELRDALADELREAGVGSSRRDQGADGGELAPFETLDERSSL